MHPQLDLAARLSAWPATVRIYAMRLLIWGLCVCVSRVFVSVVLSSFVAPFSTSALGVSLPLVARYLGAASVDSVEPLVALTLAVAMFVLPLGRAADLWGHVMVFRMGLLLAVAGFALASLSPNFLMLCGALAVGGVGLAAVFGSNNALLFQAVAPDRRASAVGINSMTVYLGLLTGPFLGGFLAQVSWRAVFLHALALLLASVVLAGGPFPRQVRVGSVLIGWARRCWRFRWPWWCWASRRLLRFSQV